jgi:hypothetical protein
MMRIGLFLYWWNKSINTNNNLLGKGWTKKQPFKKRLGQNTTPIEYAYALCIFGATFS